MGVDAPPRAGRPAPRAESAERPLKFAFSDTKALESLAYVAIKWPGITPFFISKVFFFAEKWHLNKYGRPIIADTYIAMPRGPVPSTVKNIVDENFEYVDEPERLYKLLRIEKNKFRSLYSSVPEDDLTNLTASDKECFLDAINFCRGKGIDELSYITHLEKAWANAPANQGMDYENFVDDNNPHKEEILSAAREFAVYGVL